MKLRRFCKKDGTPKKGLKRLQARIRDWENTTSGSSKKGEVKSYRKPGRSY